MTETNRTERQDERSVSLPLSKMQEGLIEAVKYHKGRVRHSALNAVRGLRRAWLIAEVDPEMAYFRAITAEEEAATALMTALAIRKYPGAKSLNPRRHADKAGWIVLIQTLGRMFAESGWPQPNVRLQRDAKPPRIDLHIASDGLGLDPGYYLTPDEPLNLTIREGEGHAPPMASLFTSQLQAWAEEKGSASIRKHINDEANLRNQLLYASDQGWAEVRHADAVIFERRSRVFLLLGLVIIILQTRRHQLLAKQVVKAYCDALGINSREEIDLTPPDYDLDFLIEVRRTEDSELKASLKRKMRLSAAPGDLNLATTSKLRGGVLVGKPLDLETADLHDFGSILLWP